MVETPAVILASWKRIHLKDIKNCLKNSIKDTERRNKAAKPKQFLIPKVKKKIYVESVHNKNR